MTVEGLRSWTPLEWLELQMFWNIVGQVDGGGDRDRRRGNDEGTAKSSGSGMRDEERSVV